MAEIDIDGQMSGWGGAVTAKPEKTDQLKEIDGMLKINMAVLGIFAAAAFGLAATKAVNNTVPAKAVTLELKN